MTLTPNQQNQLLALYTAGAYSRISAKRAEELAMGNPLVIGKLRDLGLAQSGGVRRLGQQWTEYWLSDAGFEEARRLSLAHQHA